MNAHFSMYYRTSAFFALAAVLAFAALFQIAPETGAKSAAGQQGRGRSIVQTPGAYSDPVRINDWPGATALANGLKTLRLEIAENGNKFTFDETPVFGDGLPAYGNEFITEGYIYPAGTLSGLNGVNPDGSPEFPDKVIGIWTCRGWHVGDGAHTLTGPWVVSHQLYDFGSTPGRRSIATDGYETPEVGVPINRAVTGGTGEFSEARGEMTQVFLGFNASNGITLKVEIRPSKR